MTAIRVIFDGKAFIPKQSVSLPDQSEAIVIIEHNDPKAATEFDVAIRAYYENTPDNEDQAWGAATSPRSERAWEED